MVARVVVEILERTADVREIKSSLHKGENPAYIN